MKAVLVSALLAALITGCSTTEPPQEAAAAPSTTAAAPSQTASPAPLVLACEELGGTLAGIDLDVPTEQAFDALAQAADKAARVAGPDELVFEALSVRATWRGDDSGAEGLDGATDRLDSSLALVEELDAALAVCVSAGAAMPADWVG